MPRNIGAFWQYHIPNWVIFDLDGTLADITHRLHYIQDDEGVCDWDSFNMACDKDEIKTDIKHLLHMCKRNGRNVAIFTGRMDTAEKKTTEWLKRHEIEYDMLCMRKTKDFRSDTEVKREMFRQKFNKKDVWFVVDDRDKVVDMWRDLGLTCLQCQKGDY